MCIVYVYNCKAYFYVELYINICLFAIRLHTNYIAIILMHRNGKDLVSFACV